MANNYAKIISPEWADKLRNETGEHVSTTSLSAKCSVCGYSAYAYLTNTHFCEMHFDLALKRTCIISGINNRANSAEATPYDRFFRAEMFRVQPDVHNQTKWLKYLDGREQ